jgi:c-di-GMP-binding flagellar brake protein YcgR
MSILGFLLKKWKMEKAKTERSQFAFERRMNPRFQIELLVEYRLANDSRIRPGHTVNFSEDGFMICVSDRMEADENLEMKNYFTSPSGFVTIPAIERVVWADMEVKENGHYRFGVNFLNICRRIRNCSKGF